MVTLPDLPYAYDALEPWIDAETMHLHHDKHHQTYVNNYNDAAGAVPGLADRPIEDILRDPSIAPESVRAKIINNGGGVFNHSFFWSIMGPQPQMMPSGALGEAIDAAFGSLDAVKERITKAALGRFGSGWAWLVVSGDALEVTDTANQDSPLTLGKTPILGVDVWEHSYYLKYQNRRAEYLSAWWNVVNWNAVSKLYEAAIRA